MAKVRVKKKKLRIRETVCSKGPAYISTQNPCRSNPIEDDFIYSFDTKDKRETFLYNFRLIKEYIKSNHNVKKKVFDIDMEEAIGMALIEIAKHNEEKINNVESFYNYCVEYVKEIYPHYMNTMEKVNYCVGDIFSMIAADLADNILSILNETEEESDNS